MTPEERAAKNKIHYRNYLARNNRNEYWREYRRAKKSEPITMSDEIENPSFYDDPAYKKYAEQLEAAILKVIDRRARKNVRGFCYLADIRFKFDERFPILDVGFKTVIQDPFSHRLKWIRPLVSTECYTFAVGQPSDKTVADLGL